MKSIVGLSVFLLLASAVFCTSITVGVSPVLGTVEIGACINYTLTPSSADSNIIATYSTTSGDITIMPI
jgi:hypothetical protein